MRRAPNAIGAAAALLAFSCHGDSLGLEEPLLVESGTFVPGSMPGLPPLDDAAVAAGAMPQGTHVTSVDSSNDILRPGEAGKRLLGHATQDASAVGVRLAHAGTGYWIVPLGPPDPATPGEITWSMALDISANAPPGLTTLLFTAIDAKGRAGTEFAVPVCIASAVPDGLHACDPMAKLPAAVLSLTWDTPADLDLIVVAPDGKISDPRHPTTATGAKPGPGDGVFDGGGRVGCGTGTSREDLVFQSKPKPGTYFVLVNLFDACGAPSTDFNVSLHLAEGNPATQVDVLDRSGTVLASQANGGSLLGTFVTEFNIQ
jgi:hypothetical protein